MNRDPNERGHILVLFGDRPHIALGSDLSRKEAALALKTMGYAPLLYRSTEPIENYGHWQQGGTQALILKVEQLPTMALEALEREGSKTALASIRHERIRLVLASLPQQALKGDHKPCINCSFDQAEQEKLFATLFDALGKDEYSALDAAIIQTVAAAYTEFLPRYGTTPVDMSWCLDIEVFWACLDQVLLGKVPEPVTR